MSEKKGWIWCLHCERCYRVGEHRIVRDRLVGRLELCHYENCDGDLFFDGCDWEGIRRAHPEYPEIPEEGKVYPLY